MLPATLPLRVPGISTSSFLSRSHFCACLGFLLLLTLALETRPVAAQEDAYDTEVAKGNLSLRQHKWEDALKSFKHANDLRDKKSIEACLGMVQAYYGLQAYKNVVDTCEKVIELAAGDKVAVVEAYNYEGIALQSQANMKDQKKLADAEAAFRKGLALNAERAILHFNLGFTLMELNRDTEGTAELKKYISMQPDGANAAEAAKLIANPRRARETYAPDFSITTADGEYLTLDDLRGKVVLLDFWATWCPPCVSSVPAVRDLQKRFAKDPQFKMISVSADNDETKWRAFIDKNQMVWTQYYDRDRHVVRAFEVHAFPTYILLDAEGIVRDREIGSNWERLQDSIKQSLKLAAKTGPQ